MSWRSRTGREGTEKEEEKERKVRDVTMMGSQLQMEETKNI